MGIKTWQMERGRRREMWGGGRFSASFYSTKSLITRRDITGFIVQRRVKVDESNTTTCN